MNIQGSPKPISIRIQPVKVDHIPPKEMEVYDVLEMLNRITDLGKESPLRELFLVVVVLCNKMQFALDQLRQDLHLLSQRFVPVEPVVNLGYAFHEFVNVLSVN